MVSRRMTESRLGPWLLDPPKYRRWGAYLLSNLLDCRSFLGMSCGISFVRVSCVGIVQIQGVKCGSLYTLSSIYIMVIHSFNCP